jgi:hypothetical protein
MSILMNQHKDIRNDEDYDDWEYGTEPLPGEPWTVSEPELELETMPDDQVKVCLTDRGITACTYVSSMHLVEDKRKQLKAAINRQFEE